MKRNGMCPICYIKKIFIRPKAITMAVSKEKYSGGVGLTPPMGWSSWNTFKNRINENLIYETAVALKEKGLADAGYNYVNLDDNWHSSMRDENGRLQGDLTSFSRGIPALVKSINDLGLKVGIYSSNGTHTCEDLPASLGREKEDALTFARWGIEFFKYDYCHNIPISRYAPQVYSIDVAKVESSATKEYSAETAKLYGTAKLMSDKHVSQKITGLDAGTGAALFENVTVDEDGEYTLTVNIRKKGNYDKFLIAEINDSERYEFFIPPQKFWNITARFQRRVMLKKGINQIKIYNPVKNRADSAVIQYTNMGKQLISATETVAKETGNPIKPITYSICEWGKNQPWKWGATAGNLWRTTWDIRPIWGAIMAIYERNVKYYEYAKPGAFNDPDMLEVGNGKLSYDENVAHFTLWCMMASPLILGNDIRKMPDNVKEIVTNKNLIAVNQDVLGKQAKRLKKGSVDVLAKPLADKSVALCIFNKRGGKKKVTFDVKELIKDSYVSLINKPEYDAADLWSGECFKISDNIKVEIPSHGVKVFKIK